jgi:DNA-binding transcriptional regulator YiaG
MSPKSSDGRTSKPGLSRERRKYNVPTSSPLRDEALFSRIVENVRQAALTTAEIAEIVGVDERQVYNWASRASKPRGQNKDRLLEVKYIVEALGEIYTPEGIDIWLHGRNRSLKGEKPIDLLTAGDFKTVIAAIDRLKTGAM